MRLGIERIMLRSQIATTFLPTRALAPAEWLVAAGHTPYPDALATMEARAQAIAAGKYLMLPLRAEEMYDPETFGRGSGDRVVIQ